MARREDATDCGVTPFDAHGDQAGKVALPAYATTLAQVTSNRMRLRPPDLVVAMPHFACYRGKTHLLFDITEQHGLCL